MNLGDPDVIRGLMRLGAGMLAELYEHRERQAHNFRWREIARPDQIAPGEHGSANARRNWEVWFLMAGRGFGKTRTGAEWVREQVMQGRRRYMSLIAPTLDDARKFMIEGPSGILSVSPKSEGVVWRPNKRELAWPNGAIANVYTTEEPERLRGPEHDGVWGDEIGAWRNSEAVWNNMQFGLRRTGPKGDHPQVVVTSSPRPTALIRRIVAMHSTVITHGTTYDNQANLDPQFLGRVKRDYEGTRLGEQELLGKLLGDTPGAMFRQAHIDEARVVAVPFDLTTVVVAIDPSVADDAERQAAEREQRYLAECGIVVAGTGRCICQGVEDNHSFVLADLSGFYQPEEWAGLAVEAYDTHSADRIIAEVNNGGALVGATVRAYGARGRTIRYKAVTASRGKAIRAEPVATLYEKRWVHHVGVFPQLEDQMTTWNPLLSKRSPDRLDANVWAQTDLMLGPKPPRLSSLPTVHVPRRI